MALHVKKGDLVQIITGDQKGVTGRILSVNPSGNTVIVQGHNLAKKHVRPSRRNPQGGRINVEQPIHISNVLPVNPKTNQGTRIHLRVESDGAKKRVATDGTEIGVTVKARK